MHIITGYPPIIDQIDAAFKTVGQPVFYAWGMQIFNPMDVAISDAVIEHERIHGHRQAAFIDDDGERGISAWWMRYIRDPAFRLAEEIPAHRAEWEWHARQPNADRQMTGWRSRKLYHLNFIAKRLASPLYGGLISLADAKLEIANGRC